MKSAVSNAKITSDGIKGRLHCEGRAQCPWRPCEMRHKKKNFPENEQSVSSVGQLQVPKYTHSRGPGKEGRTEEVCEEMMDKIFPNFMKTINTQIPKAQQTPSARNGENSTEGPHDQITQTRDKESVLQDTGHTWDRDKDAGLCTCELRASESC